LLWDSGQGVDLTHSARPRAMTGICAKQTAGVDIKWTLRPRPRTSLLCAKLPFAAFGLPLTTPSRHRLNGCNHIKVATIVSARRSASLSPDITLRPSASSSSRQVSKPIDRRVALAWPFYRAGRSLWPQSVRSLPPAPDVSPFTTVHSRITIGDKGKSRSLSLGTPQS
jgi:hypothetical protein